MDRQKIMDREKDRQTEKDMERLVSKGKSQKEVILFKYMIFKSEINKLMIEKNENQIQNI